MSEDDPYQKLDEDKLITDTSGHHTKKRKLKSEPWNSDVHEILGGKALIFRTKLSGKNYQFRLWLPSEKRYYTKSLRTKNLEDAIEKAEDEYLNIISEVKQGYKIFSVTFKVLTDEYLKHQQQRVDSGMITQGRHTTIHSQIKHFLKFVSENNKVDSVRGAKFKDYYKFRRKHNPEVLDVTLKNERSTISNLYKWGAENGYLNVNTNPTFDELKFSVPKKRNAFLLEDYQKLYTYLQSWEKGIKDENEVFWRKIVRDFILILANTGLRFGETRQLMWKDVEVQLNKSKKTDSSVYVTVRAEIAKTRRERVAVGMRGDIFLRIKEYSLYTRPNDYVFTDPRTGTLIGRDKYYEYWSIICDNSGLKDSHRTYTFYSLRHFFATMRLQEGKIDVFILSKILGTSVKNIEDHYGQVTLKNMTDYITRRKT